MVFARRVTVAVLLAAALVSAAAARREGEGIQTAFSADQWPSLLNDLKDAKLDRHPYHMSKRTRAFDHDVRVLTPFAKAALFVQADKKDEASLTFEAVAKHLDPSTILVLVESQHRAQKSAEGVTAALKVDGRMVDPVLEGIDHTMYKTVGYYAEKMFVCQKRFVFDMQELKGAKSLALVLTEPEGKTLDMEIDLAKLR